MTKRQVCFQIDEKDLKKFEKIKKETGLPVSRQIELKLMGWSIIKENKTDIEIDAEIDKFNSELPYYRAREKVKEYLRNNVFVSAVAEQTCLDFDVIKEVMFDLFEYVDD